MTLKTLSWMFLPGILLSLLVYGLTHSVALATIALMVGLFGSTVVTTLQTHEGEGSPWRVIGLQGVLYMVFAAYFGWMYLGELEERSPVLTETDGVSLADLQQEGPAAERLTEWLDAQIGRQGFPALDVAIADQDGLRFAHLAGDPETEASDATPLFQVASVSKAFTSVLMLRMAQEGLIDLHQPIAAHLPSDVQVTTDPSAKERITPWMLSVHASGLPRSVDVVLRERGTSYNGFDRDAFYGRLANATLEFEPGEGRQYSNLGYGLLGHVLSLAGGERYQELLRTHVLRPLELGNTTYLDYDDPNISKRLPTPHRGGAGSSTEPRADLSERLVASGGLATTAADMARMGAAVLAQPSALLDAEHQAMLLGLDPYPPQVNSTPFGSAGTSERLGHIVRKNGGRVGADAYLLLSPEHSLAVAVVTNRYVVDYEGSTGDVAKTILGWMLAPPPP